MHNNKLKFLYKKIQIKILKVYKTMISIDRKLNKKYCLKGYTLVEISIVLLIIGILTAAIVKGKSMIESAKLDSVVNDIRTIQIAQSQYHK